MVSGKPLVSASLVDGDDDCTATRLGHYEPVAGDSAAVKEEPLLKSL